MELDVAVAREREDSGPTKGMIRNELERLPGVDSCQVATIHARTHVLIHGGALSQIAGILDLALGPGTYDLTYTGAEQ